LPCKAKKQGGKRACKAEKQRLPFVGTHGSCVRSVGNVSQYTLARASAQDEWQVNSMVVEANARSVLGGRTSRASLHALAQLAISTILHINLAMTGM